MLLIIILIIKNNREKSTPHFGSSVKCSQVQQGFIIGMPRAHINTSLIDGCLKNETKGR